MFWSSSALWNLRFKVKMLIQMCWKGYTLTQKMINSRLIARGGNQWMSWTQWRMLGEQESKRHCLQGLRCLQELLFAICVILCIQKAYIGWPQHSVASETSLSVLVEGSCCHGTSLHHKFNCLNPWPTKAVCLDSFLSCMNVRLS